MLRRKLSYYYYQLTLPADIKHKFKALQTIYKKINATRISVHERERLKLSDYALTYGEIEFVGLVKLLEFINPKSTDIFLDLGSGSGKAVIACASLYHIKMAIGIELLPALYQVSVTISDQLKLPNVKFINADYFTEDISFADIIYVNATGLFGENIDRLNQKLMTLKAGSHIIINSKQLSLPRVKLLGSMDITMSWGLSRCYIYQLLSI